MKENSPICPKWFKDGLVIFESIFLSIWFEFSDDMFVIIEFGDFVFVSWPLRNAGNIGLGMLLFLILKNFFAFSSSSQLLAGDHMIFGLDEIGVVKDVGVLGLIS